MNSKVKIMGYGDVAFMTSMGGAFMAQMGGPIMAK